MATNDETPDPFAQLADWARQTERRVRNDRRRVTVGRRVPMFLVGGALVVLLATAGPRFLPPAHGASPLVYPTASVPDGVTVTTSVRAAPTDPFANTPAATYAKGAAGITLPRAVAVPGFTAAQVDASLQQVRRALIAGRLDDRMLTGHDPSRFLALLAPNSRARESKRFTDATFGGYATWIDPAVKLDPGEQPRVSGRVTYKSVSVDGRRTLRVTTNFIWVYAFTTGGENPLAARHEEANWEFSDPYHLRPGDQGMWVGDVNSYGAWVDCLAAGRGLLAPTRPDAAHPRPSSSEDENALLEADHSVDIDGNC